MSVSGFDPIAQKYADPNMTRYLRSWLPETQEFVSYDRAGVEEVIPLARMVEVFGQCIAPIMPADEKARYHVPDKDKEPENWARHRRKMETKKIRQDAHLSQAGFAPDFLMGGVMQDYRTF